MSYPEILFRCIVAVTVPALASWATLEVMRVWSDVKRAAVEREARRTQEAL